MAANYTMVVRTPDGGTEEHPGFDEPVLPSYMLDRLPRGSHVGFKRFETPRPLTADAVAEKVAQVVDERLEARKLVTLDLPAIDDSVDRELERKLRARKARVS